MMLHTEDPPELVVAEPKPADNGIWEALDLAGWETLEQFYRENPKGQRSLQDRATWEKLQAERLAAARYRFQQALKFAGGSSYYQGRSQAGLVWIDYFELVRSRPPDPQATQASRVAPLLAACKSAEAKIATHKNNDRDYFLARVNQLHAILQLESCDGAEADKFLSQASALYRTLGTQNRLYDVLHLEGKLLQCRQEYARAIAIFQQVEQSPELERQVRGFLDRVNTLQWIGRVREAWQNFRAWQSYQQKLIDNDFYDLWFRGQVLFARIATRYGALDTAEQLLQDIDCTWRCRPPLSGWCASVLAIVRSEYHVQRGELIAARSALDILEHEVPVPRKGYDCFEILFLESKCRQCITESWYCERWSCDACGCCTAELIQFKKDTQSTPIDIHKMLCSLADGIRSRIYFLNGDWSEAEKQLTKVIAEIRTVFPADPLVDLPLRIALLRVIQARDNEPVRVQQQSNEILNALARLEGKHGKRLEEIGEVWRALGLWRSEQSEDDIAKRLLEKAVPFELAARDPNHPDTLALVTELIQVESQLPDAPLDVLETRIEGVLQRFDGEVDCLDIRRLSALRTLAWIRFFQGCHASAMSCFQRLQSNWIQMQERNEARVIIEDSRVLMGLIAAELECGANWSDVTVQFHDAIQKIAANSNLFALAHDFNRMALLLRSRHRLRSAYFFARKSLDQYQSMGSQKEAEIVAKTVELLRREAADADVDIRERLDE
ncbi:MAG: hypothetical protein WCI02_02680 [Planctomycetota bacterium]